MIYFMYRRVRFVVACDLRGNDTWRERMGGDKGERM